MVLEMIGFGRRSELLFFYLLVRLILLNVIFVFSSRWESWVDIFVFGILGSGVYNRGFIR